MNSLSGRRDLVKNSLSFWNKLIIDSIYLSIKWFEESSEIHSNYPDHHKYFS